MKHAESSIKTKKALASSLKKAMAKKPLRKITVTEIVNDCNVNRKTFYYHFEDIFALLKWILEQDAIEFIKQYDMHIGYRDAIALAMDYVENNSYIINCVYDTLGRDEMKRFLRTDFINIVNNAIESTQAELGIRVGDDYKLFLCSMLTEAIVGVLIEWFRGQNRHSRETTIEYLSTILSSSITAALKNAPPEALVTR
ncbi:MAG: TetR/AcrR family transcriptional regulator C-terminal domain-containing protein [Eubacteriales bacterium]|nr:TetR/AcrR family transcriptional regulator C-terminal domain-containing protein [Clostridiales bacterium]MDY5731645.1 TetR/AcrR family transcriptional regulator C-terminal domain-containing protein [Eubacteriales bacterium]